MADPQSPLPFTIEKMLALAATDAAFRQALCEDRIAAAEARGFALSETERAILQAVPAEQLATMIDKVAGQALPEESPHVVSFGIRPDAGDPTRGISPDRPQSPIVKGIRPGRVAAAAAVASAVLAGAAGSMMIVTGSRPDPPPVTQPAEKAAENDADHGGEPPDRDGALDSQTDAGAK